MYNGDGSATLINLGAVTEFGKPVVEGMPVEMALGADLSFGSAKADLIGLAATLWWALRRSWPPSGATALTLAVMAERDAMASSAPKVMLAIAAILREERADAALAAVEAIVNA